MPEKGMLMNRSFLFAALIAGTVLAPQLASADAMSSHEAMAGPNTVMVCRAAKADEKANAMTTTKEALVCKTVDMKKMPDSSQMKSASEADKAWRQFFSIQMNSL
jgi:hypothetical protein